MVRGYLGLLCLIFLIGSFSGVCSLDNGLAKTPPMGWCSWERFRCNTDCDTDPDNCIGEKLMKEIADAMVDNGYLSVGYNYLTIDDCWLSEKRDPTTRELVPDPKRFPNGMRALIDYVHSKGLKFGIYEDFGTQTCGGYPGSEFYMQLDAQTFANWGVDMLKFDGCNSDIQDFLAGYEAMGLFLNKTGRPILYSCEWPFYETVHKLKPNYAAVQKTCNMWRVYYDIEDSWDSLSSIVDFYAKNEYNMSTYAGPGGWNDPDMVIVGDFSLSYEQQRTQMAMWAIIAGPLLLSSDLRNINPESKALLQNTRVIAVNQDHLGIEGSMISVKSVEYWRRPILPDGSFAIVFHNKLNKLPVMVKEMLGDLGLDNAQGYNITETFNGKNIGLLKPWDNLTAIVNPTGVFMATAIALN